MSSSATSSNVSEDDEQNALIRLAMTIRSSFLAFIAAGSVLMIVAALAIDVFSIMPGVTQAMFLVWGVSGLLYAGGGVLLLRLIGYR